MSSNHDGNIKQYVILSEAYYGEPNLRPVPHPETNPFLRRVENVEFGFYYPTGGTSGEMSMDWYEFPSDKTVAPCLQCWCDAWHTLAQFKDVIDALAEVDGQDITPHEFCAILDRCGFVDATLRKGK